VHYSFAGEECITIWLEKKIAISLVEIFLSAKHQLSSCIIVPLLSETATEQGDIRSPHSLGGWVLTVGVPDLGAGDLTEGTGHCQPSNIC